MFLWVSAGQAGWWSSRIQASTLGFGDVSVDSHLAPSCIQVVLKVSKTDPFRKGVALNIGKAALICARWRQSWTTWSVGAALLVHCSNSVMEGL